MIRILRRVPYGGSVLSTGRNDHAWEYTCSVLAYGECLYAQVADFCEFTGIEVVTL